MQCVFFSEPMTNANVEQVVSAVAGRTLTLKYKDGEKKITVPVSAPIVTYALQGRAWRIGRDGLTPPM
jgi:hypothetical protein